MRIIADLAGELGEQRRWRLRPQWAAVDWFEALVRNEFLPVDRQRDRERRSLATIVAFAAAHVPFYREVFRRARMTADPRGDPGELAVAVPPLTRADLLAHRAELHATKLPPGHVHGGSTRTSGSTGRPVQVEHSAASLQMFTLLKQREYRWFRFDPRGTFAQIRLGREMPGRIGPGETSRQPTWPLVGTFFETGPALGYASANPIDAQVAWLERHRPDYLLAGASVLEHLALAAQERPRRPRLHGMEAIAQQLTPAMRRRIEDVFGVAVQQNYGLNEIGVVASRCPEGGRYHVHVEHCRVEVADDQGRPCRPGEPGRLLVTAFQNPAMPLLRYDTEDSAQLAEGPCPCGRTLPGFVGLVGRYRRASMLPPGTGPRWYALRDAIETLPDELFRSLRQFQVHQCRDGRFLLRVVATAPLSADFLARIRRAWEAVRGVPPVVLEIVRVDDLASPAGRKFQVFTSDLLPETPDPDAPGFSG